MISVDANVAAVDNNMSSTLEEILIFCTGCNNIHVYGFDHEIYLEFLHEDVDNFITKCKEKEKKSEKIEYLLVNYNVNVNWEY